MADKKAIIVTPGEQIHEYFQSSYTDWDCQRQAHSVEELYDGLENGTLDADETKIILFDDSLIESTEDINEVAQAIATYAPFVIVFLLVYNKDLVDLVESRVQRFMGDNNAPYWFVSQETPIDDIDDVLMANEGFLDNRVEAPQEAAIARAVGNPAIISDEELQTIKEETFDNDDNGDKPLGYVISSTSSKGGSGKSTVALTLATTLAQASKKAYENRLTDSDPLKICVVDMDTRDGQIGYYIGHLQPTILNIRVTQSVDQDVIRKNLIYDQDLGFHSLLAPKRGRTADELTPSFYRQVIETLKTMFDLIILDTSVQYFDPLINKVCLPLSDAILFIANLSPGAIYGMTRWIGEVTGSAKEGGMAIDAHKIGVVLNMVMDDVGIDKNTIGDAAVGVKIISMIPMDSKAVLAASNYNRIHKLTQNLKIGPSYYSLAEKIVNGMNGALPEEEKIKLDTIITDEMLQKVQERKSATVQVGTEPKKKRGLFGRK